MTERKTIPGWLEDPPWVRQLRGRAAARLRTRPALWRAAHAIDGWQQRTVESVMPLERVRRAAFSGALLAALDSLATYLWLTRGVAEEGNPALAAVLDAYGEGVGLLGRTVWTLGAILALHYLALRRREGRIGLAIAWVIFAGVAGIHLIGLGLLLTGQLQPRF